MRYMGGKFRQRKEIVNALRPYVDGGTTYVEPFLGGAWSFSKVLEDLRPGHAVGADVNGSLIELWRKVVDEGTDWLPTSLEEVETDWHRYKEKDRDGAVDPLIAWYGAACSFGGRWFAGIARNRTDGGVTGFEAQARSTDRKAAAMRKCPDLRILCCSYRNLEIPDGAVVYCDPPYASSTVKAHRSSDFDVDAYYGWVRELSERCVVVCTTFDPPEDFEVLYDWGDTRVTHLNGRDRAERPTSERLVRWEGGLK